MSRPEQISSNLGGAESLVARVAGWVCGGAAIVGAAAALSDPWLGWAAFYLACLAVALVSRRPLMALTELTLFLLIASPHDVELFDRFDLNLRVAGLKLYFDDILLVALILSAVLAGFAGGEASRRIVRGMSSPFGLLLSLWTGAMGLTVGLGIAAWGWKAPFSDARFLLGYWLFLPLSLFIGDPAAMRRLTGVFLWGLAAHAGVLLIIWLGADSYAAWLPRELRSYDPYAGQGLRIFFNTTSVMPLALLPGIAAWAVSGRAAVRWRASGLIAAASFSLLLASTRSLLAPVAACAVVLAAALLLHGRAPRGLPLKIVLGAGVFVALTVAAAVFSPSFRRVADTFTDRIAALGQPGGRGPLENRIETASYYIDQFQEAPWLGHGFGSRMAFHYRGMVIEHGYYIDFSYLSVAYKGGLAALLPMLALTLLPAAQLFRIAWRRRPDPEELIVFATGLGLVSLLFAAGCMTPQLICANPVIAALVGAAALAEHLRRDSGFFGGMVGMECGTDKHGRTRTGGTG